MTIRLEERRFPSSSSSLRGHHNKKGFRIGRSLPLFVDVFVVVALVLQRGPLLVGADWGDYVDPTFECPAMTTCQRVCVANVSDCPLEMKCNATTNLCADGSCSSEPCDPSLTSPCAYRCANVACAKINDYYNNCLANYGGYYDNETTCGEAEVEAVTNLYTFTEPVFVGLYSFFGAVTFLVVAWCAYNQRLDPVYESTKPLQVSAAHKNDPTKEGVKAPDEFPEDEYTKKNNGAPASKATDDPTTDAFKEPRDEEAATSFQTGYRFHPVGLVLWICVLVILVGIQALLAYLTIMYYVQQDAITKIPKAFEDEVQVLLAFEYVWMIGFVWTFCFKWPHSISGLFFRRCTLDHARYVAVCVQRGENEVVENSVFDQHRHIRRLRAVFSMIGRGIGFIMTNVFSDAHTFGLNRNVDGIFEICRVRVDDDGTRYFMFMFRRYVLERDRFVPGQLHVGTTLDDIASATNPTVGLNLETVQDRRHVVGPNLVDMGKPNVLRTLWKQVSQPFYTWQMFFVWTWMNFWYYYMALVWLFVILAGLAVVVTFQYRNEDNLYQLTRIAGVVRVVREGEAIEIPQEELVPGDVVCVTAGTAFCDMLLIEGGATLVDEGALTGEAHPIGKVPIDRMLGEQVYDVKNHKRSTIMAGTRVIQSESGLAICLKTASFTARGELIRDIFTYKRHHFKFDAEVPVVMAILLCYAIFAFAMAFYWTGQEFAFGWFYGMFVVATVIPPLLPTVFTVAVGISDDRLSRQRIACTQSESILVAGKVKKAFFDKTGTLTKQGLDFVSARSASNWSDKDPGGLGDFMVLGMATCHSLTRTMDGELIGNPVDKSMFDASGGTVDANDASIFTDCNGTRVQVVRHFDFDFHRMTQSVVLKRADGSLVAFVKGSGEAVSHVCSAESMPSDFDAMLESCAKAGIYQISMASKELASGTDPTKISRDEVEAGLSFCGCINFKNLIRENTATVIKQLEEGEIDSVMVTGDSVLTGICIGKEAGIVRSDAKVLIGQLQSDKVVWTTESGESIDLPSVGSSELRNCQLAISGRVWASLLTQSPDLAADLLDNVRVVGRCTPRDKVSVVSEYVKAGFVTLMSGDGGNDCGALKMAHVGVALSDAEASIVAPFTSLDKDIASVVAVVREGRCSLASALASYKFMIMYGQVETINQLINAYFLTTFTEWCWVWMDGIWTITLAFSLPLSHAETKLSPSRPTASLLGPWTMSSTLGVLAINFSFTVGALAYLNSQEWYQCRKWNGGDVSNLLIIGDNYETEVIFLVSGFQYVIAAMAYNFGYEFRRAWIFNIPLVCLVTIYTVIQFYITLVPSKLSCVFHVNCENEQSVRAVVEATPIPIQNPFNTTVMPPHFRNGLIGLMVGNIIAVCGYEYFIVNGIRQYCGRKRRLAASRAATSGKELEGESATPSPPCE